MRAPFIVVVTAVVTIWRGAAGDEVAAVGADGEVSSYAPIAGLTRGARADEILTGYSRLTGAPHRKVFAGETLAYVTPWNSGGYNVAKQHAGKFDFLSPVWLQVREDEGSPEGIKITGLHDIDRGWIADVRANCSTVEGAKCPLIVPRIVWEARRGGPNVLQRAVTIIKNVVRDNTFDGVTLEAPPTPTFIPFIEALGKALHGMKPTRGMKARADAFRADHDDDGDDGGASGGAGASSYGRALVLVLPPNVAGAEDRASATGSGANAVIHEQLVSLARFVDRFSVMTYDHSVHRGASSGPNAPLRWVRETVQAMLGGGGGAGSSAAAAGAAADPARQRLAKKILMGLPFYGYDNRDAILGHQWMDRLKRHRGGLKADKHAVEHYVAYADEAGAAHRAYYPTPWMLAKRLQLATALGTGVSIWEIGQGLPYFYSLL